MRRFLITGCQRSGTTMMGLILDSHKDIQHTDEANFSPASLTGALEASLHSYKLPKEAVNIPFITNTLKPEKVIWMVRNPFDVVKSMIALHIKKNRMSTESWAATYAHLEINRALQLLPYEATLRVEDELENYRKVLSQATLRDSMHGLIVAAATCWSIKQLGLNALKNANVKVKVVRYEDLVSNPKHILKGCCKFLEIDWDDNLLNHHQLHSGVSIGDTKNDRAIDIAGVLSSREFFTKQEFLLINKLTSKLSKQFQYPNGKDSVIEMKESTIEFGQSLGSYKFQNANYFNFFVSNAINTNNKKELANLLNHAIKNGQPELVTPYLTDKVHRQLEPYLSKNVNKHQRLIDLLLEKKKFLPSNQPIKTYIHIGQHKTGTTSIQNYLKENRSTLIDQGLYIPNSIMGIKHPSHYILNVYALSVGRSSTMKDRLLIDKDDRFFETLESNLKADIEWHYQEAKRLGCTEVVWSNEGLYLLNSQEEYERLIDLFSQYSNEIICICCFRDKESYKTSYIKQLEKQCLPPSKDKDSYLYIENDSWLFNYERKKKLLESTFTQTPIYLTYKDEGMIEAFMKAIKHDAIGNTDIRLNITP